MFYFNWLRYKVKFTTLNISILCFVTNNYLLLSTKIGRKLIFLRGYFYGKHR